MEDFLLKYYSYVTFAVEFLAVITGLILYKKYKHAATKYFIWFLVYLTICDTLSNYVRFIRDGFLHFLHGTIFAWNYWWCTLFWKIGAIAFFIFYYRKVLKIERLRAVLKYVNIVFLIYAFGCILLNFDEYFVKSFISISIIGAIIIIICAMFYFYEVVQSNSVLSVLSLLIFTSVSQFLYGGWLLHL
ncbi:hypothetical protein [Neotamlana nanhaiensis]|uniref:hypothetical protein n=1 Tax=Neotamlana nanhaiensis TaxID=1382798 RepID=UPI001EE35555|nr:hypothetical protein [Tamlana nanhaiensis]